MGKKNKGKKQVFNPPVRKPVNPYTTNLSYRQIKEAYNKEILQAADNSFNIVVSSMLIAAKDMGMNIGQIKTLQARCYGVLDDVADNLATIDSLLLLCKEMGIEIIENNNDITRTTGELIFKKTSVYQCLECGIEEIEDIIRTCKNKGVDITYRDACAHRFTFNQIK